MIQCVGEKSVIRVRFIDILTWTRWREEMEEIHLQRCRLIQVNVLFPFVLDMSQFMIAL